MNYYSNGARTMSIGSLRSNNFSTHFITVMVIILICQIPFFALLNERVEALGGISAHIYLDPETRYQEVGISSDDPVIEVKVLGQINLTSTFPHIIQNVVFEFELRIVGGLYYMDDHLDENYYLEPDPLAFSNIMPNTMYEFPFEITIIVDKYFEPAEYKIIIEPSWSNEPGSVEGTMRDSDPFHMAINRYEAVEISGDEEVVIDRDVGGFYHLNLVNNGNINIWSSYEYLGRESAKEKGIVITGSDIPSIIGPGIEGTYRVFLECEHAEVGAATKITFIW